MTLPPVAEGKVRIPIKNRLGLFVDVSDKLKTRSPYFRIYMDQARQIWVRNILDQHQLLKDLDPKFEIQSMVPSKTP